MAPGSDHPTEGVYRGLDLRTGNLLDTLPDPQTLPILPLDVALSLTKRPSISRVGLDREGGEPLEGDEPCYRVKEAYRHNWATGSRHDMCRDRMYELACLLVEGHRGVDLAIASLRDSYVEELELHPRGGSEDPPSVEFTRMWRGARSRAERSVEAQAELNSCECDIPAWETEIVSAWETRPILMQIRDLARARMISEWALLGAYLARVSAEIPPWVVLPPIVGGQMPLSLFVALTGEPGSGKSAAIAVSRELGRTLDQLVDGWSVSAVGPGSGEGLVRSYAEPVKDKDPDGNPTGWRVEWHTTRCLMVTDEIGTLESLQERAGTTLPGLMRTAWSGGEMGNQYADQAKRITLPAHSYRLAVIVGAQPDRSGWILKEHSAGTPQRYLWFRANSSEVFMNMEDPELINTAFLPPEIMNNSGYIQEYGDLTNMEVPEPVRQEVIKGRARAQLGQSDQPGQHADAQRLRVAAVLAIADGRMAINEEDWQLGTWILRHSEGTYQGLLEHQRQARRQANRAKAIDAGDQSAIQEEQQVHDDAKLIARTIWRHSETPPTTNSRSAHGEYCSKQCARDAVRRPKGSRANDGLAEAIRIGWIAPVQVPTGNAVGAYSIKYRCVLRPTTG